MLILSISSLAFNIKPAKGEWTGTVYIRADGSIDPPDAPIITYDNVTYTLIGNITSFGDGIVVERCDIIIDGSGYALEGPWHFTPRLNQELYSGVYIQACRVTVKNMKIKNFFYGVFSYLEDNNITENDLVNNARGICLNGGFNGIFNNVVAKNNITNNYDAGIMLFGILNNNMITNNRIINNSRHGIWSVSDEFHDNVISANIFINDGWYLGELSSNFYDNIVVNNTVNGKPLVYLENISNATVGDSGQVILVNCSEILVNALNLSNTDAGIQLWKTTNTIVTGCNISDCSFVGISLKSSYNNTISANNFNRSDNNTSYQHGLWLSRSDNNTIYQNVFINTGLHVSDSYDNIVANNLVNGKPLIYLQNVSNITIEDAGQIILVHCEDIKIEKLKLSNTAVGIELLGTNDTAISENDLSNSAIGIFLGTDSYGNVIAKNNLVANFIGVRIFSAYSNIFSRNRVIGCAYGVSLSLDSSGNILYENDILSNFYSGLQFYRSSVNEVYHNNIINNTIQVDFKDSWNIFDDGYPSGGNYWSDYNGADSNGDGIGDTPYIIDEYNVDHYPLMGPWTSEGANVSVTPSSELTITFKNVTSAGITTASKLDTGPEPPSGFKLAENYYDIETTANYAETIELRITYDDCNMTVEEETSLSLMHWDETLQQWINITTLLDTENNIIYGETNHLSTFAITVPYIPGDVDGDLKVKMDDIIAICDAFGSKVGQPKYDPNLDINNDNKISMDDIMTAVEHFGQHYP